MLSARNSALQLARIFCTLAAIYLEAQLNCCTAYVLWVHCPLNNYSMQTNGRKNSRIIQSPSQAVVANMILACGINRSYPDVGWLEVLGNTSHADSDSLIFMSVDFILSLKCVLPRR